MLLLFFGTETQFPHGSDHLGWNLFSQILNCIPLNSIELNSIQFNSIQFNDFETSKVGSIN